PPSTSPALLLLRLATLTPTHTLSLHDALPISTRRGWRSIRTTRSTPTRWPAKKRSTTPSPALLIFRASSRRSTRRTWCSRTPPRSEEHTSELQSHLNLVCRLLLEKKQTKCKNS